MNMTAPLPISEQYRSAAHHWARMDGDARKLEEMKTSTLAKMMKALAGGEKPPPLAAAERDVKASQEWHDFITEMVMARTSANDARVEMDYLMMKHEEACGPSQANTKPRWKSE